VFRVVLVAMLVALAVPTLAVAEGNENGDYVSMNNHPLTCSERQAAAERAGTAWPNCDDDAPAPAGPPSAAVGVVAPVAVATATSGAYRDMCRIVAKHDTRPWSVLQDSRWDSETSGCDDGSKAPVCEMALSYNDGSVLSVQFVREPVWGYRLHGFRVLGTNNDRSISCGGAVAPSR
jgi:hypothetical protein